jgi:hypothetical protein
MDDNVVRLCVNGRKIEPGMNAQLYTLRDVTRLPRRLDEISAEHNQPESEIAAPRTERIHIPSAVNVTSSACRSGSGYPQVQSYTITG